eukprot:COSAG01_NODE_1428_length_10331_cov_68.357995_1_plen_52_part_10
MFIATEDHTQPLHRRTKDHTQPSHSRTEDEEDEEDEGGGVFVLRVSDRVRPT